MSWWDKDTETKPFLEHLDDLRKTALLCAAFLILGMLCVAPFVPELMVMLKSRLTAADIGVDTSSFLQPIHVTGGFAIAMKIIFWGGMIISLPVQVVFISRFIFPGLRASERSAVVRSLVMAGGLFCLGVWMGYEWTLPVAIRVMYRVNEWIGISWRMIELSDYLAFSLKLLLAFGLAFELPVVVWALGSMGLVTSEQLRRVRPQVVVVLLILAMLLTPPDVITQLMMAVPMVILYECCIWLTWFKERKNSRQSPG